MKKFQILVLAGLFLAGCTGAGSREVSWTEKEPTLTQKDAPYSERFFCPPGSSEVFIMNRNGGAFTAGRGQTSVNYDLSKSGDRGASWSRSQVSLEGIRYRDSVLSQPIAFGDGWAIPMFYESGKPGLVKGDPAWQVKFAQDVQAWPTRKATFFAGNPQGAWAGYQADEMTLKCFAVDASGSNWQESEQKLSFTGSDFKPEQSALSAASLSSDQLTLAGIGRAGNSVRQNQIYLANLKSGQIATTVLPELAARGASLVGENNELKLFALHGFASDSPDKCYFLIYTSKDGAASWSKPTKFPLTQALAEGPAPFSLVQEGASLLLTYMTLKKTLFASLSQDSGASWSKPISLGEDVLQYNNGFSDHKPVVISRHSQNKMFVSTLEPK